MIGLLLLALLARDEVSDLIARLRAAPESQQYTIAVQLSPLVKLNHLPLLVKETDAGPENLRPHFIRAIGRIGGNEAKTVLRSLCMRNDFASRAEAANQLTRLQDDFGPKTLLDLLPKASSDNEKMAVLGQLFGASANAGDAVPVLAKFLDKESADAVRRQAVRVLGTNKDAAALPVLWKVASDPKDAARFDALAELLRRGDDAAMEDALKGLEEGKTDLSATYQILNALEQSNKRAALPRLRDLAEKSDNRNVKIAVIRSLATMKDDKALPLLTKLSEDPDPQVAKVATESVIRLSGRAQMETLKKAADDSDPLKKLEGAEALIQLDSPDGWAALRSALESGNASVKLRALAILSGARRKEAVDLLVTLLDDPQDYIRNNARTYMVGALTALYPYLRFDYQAPPEKLRAWWEKNRKH
jgi:HEAT repeat protein